MPILKYFIFVGLALVGLIFAFESASVSNPLSQAADQKTAAAATSRSSIGLLRAMSHHGETKSTSLAAAGPLLPMPVVTPAASSAVTAQPRAVIADAHPVAAPALIATPSALDAQARIASDDVIKPKPAKKKIAARKPRSPNRYVENPRRYVENTQRGPFDFFGQVQSW